jgi:hypothetical protein
MKCRAVFLAPRSLFAVLVLALLAACGGGGDGSDDLRLTKQIAETASENVVIPSDSSQAMSATMAEARIAVGTGQVDVWIACAAGGQVRFSVTGSSRYGVTFDNCQSGDGSIIDGSLDYAVTPGLGQDYTAAATHDVRVQLPQRNPPRTTRLTGASNFDHRVSGDGRSTTDRWTAASIGIVTTTGSRTNSFSLLNVDLSRIVVTDAGGSVVSRTTRGTCTLVAVIDGVSLNFTWRSDGDVRFGIDGLPTDGSWSLGWPNNLIGLEVRGSGVLRYLAVEVDHGIYLPIFPILVIDLPFRSG